MRDMRKFSWKWKREKGKIAFCICFAETDCARSEALAAKKKCCRLDKWEHRRRYLFTPLYLCSEFKPCPLCESRIAIASSFFVSVPSPCHNYSSPVSFSCVLLRVFEIFTFFYCACLPFISCYFLLIQYCSKARRATRERWNERKMERIQNL